jgi:hypothetical protein
MLLTTLGTAVVVNSSISEAKGILAPAHGRDVVRIRRLFEEIASWPLMRAHRQGYFR